MNETSPLKWMVAGQCHIDGWTGGAIRCSFHNSHRDGFYCPYVVATDDDDDNAEEDA